MSKKRSGCTLAMYHSPRWATKTFSKMKTRLVSLFRNEKAFLVKPGYTSQSSISTSSYASSAHRSLRAVLEKDNAFREGRDWQASSNILTAWSIRNSDASIDHFGWEEIERSTKADGYVEEAATTKTPLCEETAESEIISQVPTELSMTQDVIRPIKAGLLVVEETEEPIAEVSDSIVKSDQLVQVPLITSPNIVAKSFGVPKRPSGQSRTPFDPVLAEDAVAALELEAALLGADQQAVNTSNGITKLDHRVEIPVVDSHETTTEASEIAIEFCQRPPAVSTPVDLSETMATSLESLKFSRASFPIKAIDIHSAFLWDEYEETTHLDILVSKSPNCDGIEDPEDGVPLWNPLDRWAKPIRQEGGSWAKPPSYDDVQPNRYIFPWRNKYALCRFNGREIIKVEAKIREENSNRSKNSIPMEETEKAGPMYGRVDLDNMSETLYASLLAHDTSEDCDDGASGASPLVWSKADCERNWIEACVKLTILGSPYAWDSSKSRSIGHSSTYSGLNWSPNSTTLSRRSSASSQAAELVSEREYEYEYDDEELAEIFRDQVCDQHGRCTELENSGEDEGEEFDEYEEEEDYEEGDKTDIDATEYTIEDNHFNPATPTHRHPYTQQWTEDSPTLLDTFDPPESSGPTSTDDRPATITIKTPASNWLNPNPATEELKADLALRSAPLVVNKAAVQATFSTLLRARSVTQAWKETSSGVAPSTFTICKPSISAEGGDPVAAMQADFARRQALSSTGTTAHVFGGLNLWDEVEDSPAPSIMGTRSDVILSEGEEGEEVFPCLIDLDEHQDALEPSKSLRPPLQKETDNPRPAEIDTSKLIHDPPAENLDANTITIQPKPLLAASKAHIFANKAANTIPSSPPKPLAKENLASKSSPATTQPTPIPAAETNTEPTRPKTAHSIKLTPLPHKTSTDTSVSTFFSHGPNAEKPTTARVTGSEVDFKTLFHPDETLDTESQMTTTDADARYILGAVGIACELAGRRFVRWVRGGAG